MCRARHEIHAASAGVDIDDDVAHREEHRREVMRDLARDRALGLAGKGAIHVHAIERREARRGARRGQVQRRDEDDAAVDLLRLQFPRELHRRDLPLVLVAVVPAEHEHRRPLPARDDGDRHHDIRPAAEIVGVGNLEEALLFAGRVEIETGIDHPGGAVKVVRRELGGRLHRRHP